MPRGAVTGFCCRQVGLGLLGRGRRRRFVLAPRGALRAEGELAPDDGAAQGPCAGDVGRLDAVVLEELSEPGLMRGLFAAQAGVEYVTSAVV